ncbi:MAG: carboxypeptidase-like regulatory domain-containing protein, partial [Candidatus Acidiferrales bacterium]
MSKVEVSLDPQNEKPSNAAGVSRVTRTGPDGAFAFSDVPAGSYAMSAWRNGFADYSCRLSFFDCHGRSLTLAPGQKIENIELRLNPAGVITGTVYDEDQEPVAGIQVYSLRVDFLRGGRRELYPRTTATTDDQGNFRMPGLQPGSYYVRAGGLIEHPMKSIALKDGPSGGLQYRDTYYPGAALLDEAQSIEARPGLETNNIRIPLATEKTFSITGAIVDAGKSAGPKPSEVQIAKRSDVEQMWGSGGMSLDPDGSFVLRGLSPGEYTLTATGEVIRGNYAEQIDEGFASVRIVDSDVRANIEIGRASEVRGKLTAPEGFSLAGKQVILETRGMRLYPSDIGASGAFDIRNVAPGEYTLSISDTGDAAESSYLKRALCSGRDYATQSLVLDLGVSLDCQLTVGNDAGVVSGQVTDSGKPVPGLVVVLIPESLALRRLPRYTLEAKTDDSGHYKLEGAI